MITGDFSFFFFFLDFLPSELDEELDEDEDDEDDDEEEELEGGPSPPPPLLPHMPLQRQQGPQTYHRETRWQLYRLQAERSIVVAKARM